LKKFAKALASWLPVDYYTVFSELERALAGELDFHSEAQSCMKVYASVSHTADGRVAPPAVGVPLPVQGLVSRRVLVMDFVEGTPLNRLQSVMEAKGIKPGSPESKLAGRRILLQLTEAFGRMMLGAGFIHGDPHPGNIFVQEGAKVALIDCGQVKQISTDFRLQLAEAILLVNRWTEEGGSAELVALAQEKMAGFGVTFAEDAKPEAAAALALLLFADPDVEMPAGFSSAELSADSPIKAISSFPQELVLLGRATILIKGVAKRLGIPWSLADKWKGMAEQALECGVDGCLMPTWSAPPSAVMAATGTTAEGGETPRFRQVRRCPSLDGPGEPYSASAHGSPPPLSPSSPSLAPSQVMSRYGEGTKMLGKWAAGKTKSVAGKVVPTAVKKAAMRAVAKAASR
jgi:predicted unusual protein kinase regulating ubiquinone biosynthesis (AarF/ABC1/UbiB family)